MVFIYGKLGLPALGATGAGMATAVVSWISLGLGLWVITHDRYYRRFQLRVGKPDWKSLKELLRLGIPMGGSIWWRSRPSPSWRYWWPAKARW